MQDLKIQNYQSPFNDFKRIADHLMNQNLLKINGSKFRICAVEFYLSTTSELHQDSYTHKNRKQLSQGEWYFHGSGVDITFGSQDEYGGILIQALLDVEKNIFYGGPIKSVAAIFDAIGSVESKKISFGLIESDLQAEKIIEAPRVCLNVSNQKEFFSKPYRFIILPKKGHSRKGDIIKYLVAIKGLDQKTAEQEIYA